MAADETTPLLGSVDDTAPKKLQSQQRLGIIFSPAARILLAAFVISLSFNWTQTPVLYAFHIMACEEYYKHHPPYEGEGDQCAINPVDSVAAAQVAIMGSCTIVCAIANLFITGWQMRRFGPKIALAIQTFFPVVRVSVQAASLAVGAKAGLLLMQFSQVMTISGGPAGYILVLNTIASEITEPAKRTGMFGILQGVQYCGMALGYFLGGLLAEKFGIRTPFNVAAVSFSTAFVYCCLFVPYVDPRLVKAPDTGRKAKGVARFFGPLKCLGPQLMRLRDGRVKKHYGILFLALGVFSGVLATGYAPTLIQMYSMTVFSFSSTNNSLLMAVACLIRGIFLMFIFPRIISYGRIWYKTSAIVVASTPETEQDQESAIPTEPRDIDPGPVGIAAQEPTKPPKPVTRTEGSGFDLFFLRWSLLADGLIMCSSAFATQGWHMYLVGFLLPLASGTAPASKGVLTEMVPPSRKAEALQAMTLVEYMATFSTLGIFGFCFSALADIGKSYLTFYCNAAVAIVAVCILLNSSFPPDGSDILEESGEQEEPLLSEQEG